MSLDHSKISKLVFPKAPTPEQRAAFLERVSMLSQAEQELLFDAENVHVSVEATVDQLRRIAQMQFHFQCDWQIEHTVPNVLTFGAIEL